MAETIKILFPMGEKLFFPEQNIFIVSCCHTTWLQCKTSILSLNGFKLKRTLKFNIYFQGKLHTLLKHGSRGQLSLCTYVNIPFPVFSHQNWNP